MQKLMFSPSGEKALDLDSEVREAMYGNAQLLELMVRCMYQQARGKADPQRWALVS